MSGELKPGERINEVEIAETLNVSRSPVHSAIGQLVGEGLLESVSNKAVKVRELSEKQVLEVLDFRTLVESFSIRKVTENLTAQIGEKLKAFKANFLAFSSYDQLPEYVQNDNKFHNFLVDSTGNDIISETYHRYITLINPFRIISLESERRFQESIPEHTSVIDAILERDAEKAVRINSRHIHLAWVQIAAYLKERKQA